MKAKAGSGKPKTSKALQNLQTQLSLLKKKYLQENPYSSSENSQDWRDWNGSVSIRDAALSNPDDSLRKARQDFLAYFGMAHQCENKWVNLTDPMSYQGGVCLCGHPVSEHVDNGLCQAGLNICFCRRAKVVINVSDTRHFYKATKGPHEAHALLTGLAGLRASNGKGVKLVEWKCQTKGCSSSSKVGPVRMRRDVDLSLGLSVHDSHRFMCEKCLFIRLNGGY
jgi:hypothetical protein